jgi:hypothetical protein
MLPASTIRAGLVSLVVALVMALPAPAAAETISCQRAIAKAGQRYVKDRAKILRKCHNQVVRGK